MLRHGYIMRYVDSSSKPKATKSLVKIKHLKAQNQILNCINGYFFGSSQIGTLSTMLLTMSQYSVMSLP
jgi:hypothetical protein